MEKIIGGILSGIFGNSGSGHFGQIAMGLSIGGGIAKSIDANNTGIDDRGGDVALAAAKVFNALDSGERGKVKLAIVGMKAALDALESSVDGAAS